jgi:hypothetical protein
MADPPAPERMTAAERRLAEHMSLLREEAPEPGRALVRRVVRTARWQRSVRAPLRVAGALAASVIDGLGALLGLNPRRERR